MKASPLTEKQIKFANFIFQGLTNREAYQRSGYASTGASADVAASRLLNGAKVQGQLSKLRAYVEKTTILTGTEIRETLSRCIRKAEKDGNLTAVAALTDRLCRIDQHYAPEQVVHVDNRQEIAQRIRLIGPLIAGRISAANGSVKLVEAEMIDRTEART